MQSLFHIRSPLHINTGQTHHKSILLHCVALAVLLSTFRLITSAFRHYTPAKPRVARVPKARTEPWVNMDKKNKSSVGVALSARAFALRLGSAAPVGGSKKDVPMINPGLVPWARREYRPKGLIYVFINYLLILMH